MLYGCSASCSKVLVKIDCYSMKKLLTDLVRVLSLQFVILLLLIGLFALGYVFRKDILITYHRWGEKSSLKAMRQHSQPTPDEKFNRYSRKLQKHQKALIELGYYEERIFNVKYLKARSPQIEKLFAEFREIYPGCSYTCGWGKNLTITDIPERMPTWESLFEKYDVPSDEPNQPNAPAKTPE